MCINVKRRKWAIKCEMKRDFLLDWFPLESISPRNWTQNWTRLLHGNPSGKISGKLRERKDSSKRKQEMKIHKLIAPQPRAQSIKQKSVTTILHLIKGEVLVCSTHVITSSTQQIRVITHYQRKIGPESSSVCPHLPTYLDTYTQTLGSEHHLALIFLCDIYTPN